MQSVIVYKLKSLYSFHNFINTSIESLREQLHKAQVAAMENQDEDSYLNARIRFLQHQVCIHFIRLFLPFLNDLHESPTIRSFDILTEPTRENEAQQRTSANKPVIFHNGMMSV